MNTSPVLLSTRKFTALDQEWFASLSGDRNPMHMDALAARRTMAGFPVVHGIHTVLWALDSLLRSHSDIPMPRSIKVGFEKMIYVEDEVSATIVSRAPERLRLAVMVEDVTVVSCDLEFGGRDPDPRLLPDSPSQAPAEPLELTFEDMTACYGMIPPQSDIALIRTAFPALANWIGAERVAALAATTFLVGMVCPGLHSIYRGFNLSLVPLGPDSLDGLRFKVRHSDEDYRFIRLAVSGGGWVGDIDTNARPAPAQQASMAKIAAMVEPDEFQGISALVAGGSRGLGELTAKILAAGGAQVTITYAVGMADAQRVQAEIMDFGARCDIVRYDAREGADQLSSLPTTTTALYYMVTPVIFRRGETAFSSSRFQEFTRFYVTAFSELCQALSQRSGKGMAVFYPSSVSVDERPANMTEYTMAKAAGEVLCTDMAKFEKWRRIIVNRLPRLPTDQTSTLFDDDITDPAETMLPIIRQMSR